MIVLRAVFLLTSIIFFTTFNLGPRDVSNQVLTDKNEQLGKYISEVMEEYGIPGIALAVIKGEDVLAKEYHGFADIVHSVPVQSRSVFRLYSLTKPFISVGVFQLIEEGKVNLHDPIGKHVEDLPESWRQVSIGNLLSHSSGLPDMAGRTPYETRELTEEEAKERVFAMDIKFSAGDRFDYNQTNFWLLKELIENLSSESLSEFIIARQFSSSNPNTVFFSSDSRDIILNRATPYFPFAKSYLIADLPYTNGDYMFAANGLHLSLEDFIKWDKEFRNDRLISKTSKEKMWSRFPYDNSDFDFTYAWGTSAFDGVRGFGFSGSMSTIYRTYPEKELSVILLSNGFSKRYNMDEVLREISSIVLND